MLREALALTEQAPQGAGNLAHPGPLHHHRGDRAAVERDVLAHLQRLGARVGERARVLDERADTLDSLAVGLDAEARGPAAVVTQEGGGRRVAERQHAAASLQPVAL